MKQIITIFTLISFVIYIGGCSKSYLISLPEIEKQKSEFIYGVQLNNKIIIPFNEEGGELRLEEKLIRGKVNTENNRLMQVEYHFDDIKYIIVRSNHMNISSKDKIIYGIQLNNNDVIVFNESGGSFNSNSSIIEGKANDNKRIEYNLKDIKFVLLKNDFNDKRTELMDTNKYKKLYEKEYERGVNPNNKEKELIFAKYGIDKDSKLIPSDNYKKLFEYQNMIESSSFDYIALKNNKRIDFKRESGHYNPSNKTISGYLKTSELYEVNIDSVNNVFIKKPDKTGNALLFLLGVGVLVGGVLLYELSQMFEN